MNEQDKDQVPMLAAPRGTVISLVLDGNNYDKMMRFAEAMSKGVATVPKHLQGHPSDCLAIVMQSMRWGLDPFAVAQKTHMTQGGTLGYEAQLVSAVIAECGPVEGMPDYEYFGDWSKVLGKVEQKSSDKGGKYYVATYTKKDEEGLGVRCKLKLRGEPSPRVMEVSMSQCYPRFSTQWATDPRQQIAYVAIRKWARLNAPGVILGVYTPEELDSAPVSERDITPAKTMDEAAGTTATDPAIDREALVAALKSAMKSGGIDGLRAKWNTMSKPERAAVGTGTRDEIIKTTTPDPVATQDKEPAKKEEIKADAKKPLVDILLEQVAATGDAEAFDKIWEQAADLPDAERVKIEEAIKAKTGD